MSSEVKTDKLSQRGSSGIVITDDIKLSSGKAIKNAAGTALLTQAGVLDNVSLGSSVTGLPSSVMVQSKCYLITGPVTVPDGSASRTDLLTMAFTKTHNASTSKLMFQGAGRIFNAVGASQSWNCHMFTKVDTTYTAAPVTTSHGTPPAGVYATVYRLNDGQSYPFRTSTAATLGPFETTDYADGTFSFVLSHYRDGYDAITVDWFCAQITEVMI
tara:strand:- start:509 stop:1153 length:645 start_codon:yes stop_codon:yes gene_type:complete